MIKINGQNPVDYVFDVIRNDGDALNLAKQYVWENTPNAYGSLRGLSDYRVAEEYVRLKNEEHAAKVAPRVS